ncbi:MAG TPA: hypothetical protein EYN14_06990 [Alphaproteobacteria bacterium]|jgi:hypothetical protein|nr:hypothetical protein [Alphaproteobacteria bacterium]|tara:strand:+ start:17379 stop:17600 length:222 start_codon:yes stop_codon:yes gene_type:complete
MDNNQKYRAIKQKINDSYDIPDTILSPIVIRCIDGDGTISRSVRDIYRKQGVPEAVFDCAENAYKKLLIDGTK